MATKTAHECPEFHFILNLVLNSAEYNMPGWAPKQGYPEYRVSSHQNRGVESYHRLRQESLFATWDVVVPEAQRSV